MHEDDPPPSDAPRVVVIGARRRRQGLGVWLSRFVEDAGGRVVGIVGTSDETVAAALDGLAQVGIRPAGSTDAAPLVRDLRPDALVLASPWATHERYLAFALEHGLHVLCEKPLLWGCGRPAERARALARAYADRGLHLVVNAQWPWTLDAWRGLHPGVLDRVPTTFAMRLSPDSAGRAMLPDAMPHAISLLQAVVPHAAPRVEDVRLEGAGEHAEALDVRFVYVAGGARVDSAVALRRGRRQPREASYGFDGREAIRRVHVEDYRLELASDGRTVPLPDPTPRLVRSFVERVSSDAAAVVDPNAWPGMALLEAIDAAWPRVKTP